MTSAPLSSSTRLLALLGRPVGHSLSPAMQGAAIAARRLDAVYVALDCAEADFEGLLRGIARAGGGGNVTVPHKVRAASAIDDPTPAVERTGACNTFWYEGGMIRGDNTDVEGFRAAARAVAGDALGGGRALLVGAGGAAHAALAGLLDEHVAEVCILNRSRERAVGLRDRLGAGRTRVVDGPGALDGADFDLVVQATSLGLAAADPLPLDVDRCSRIGAVLDLVYTAGETTRLVAAARGRGIAAADGREMLLHQGAAAFQRWFDGPVPIEPMRSVLDDRPRP